MTDFLLRNVRPYGGAPLDVLVREGRIAMMGAGMPADGARVEDGAGALLLPGLIEGHTHLDKTLWGLPWYRNTVGPRLGDKIAGERAFRAVSGHDAGAASRRLAEAFLANGTTRIRSHVDIDTEAGLKHLRGVLQMRATLAARMDIQIVAFPQSGLLIRPGTEALLDRALAEGADLVGGLDPCGIDRDAVGSLNALFALAERHGKGIDIHLHEPDEMGAFSLDLILERTAALSMEGQVVVSHAFCLGSLPSVRRDALLARMAELHVAIATTAPASRPVPLVADCKAAGVTIFGGNDGIRDTWTPHGRPDMLHRAMLIALRNDFRRDDELEVALRCVTDEAARGCGFAEYGLQIGARADLVLLDSETAAEAVVAQPSRRLVVANGRIVARGAKLLS